MNTYNVVTPFARTENYELLKSMLLEKRKHCNIIWHIVKDLDKEFTVENNEDWIKFYEYNNKETTFYGRCNASINWFFETQITSNDFYLILNDDDAYEDNFFRKLNAIDTDKDVIICSMKRGNFTPHTEHESQRHPTDTLYATPENMRVGGVGIEQIIIRGNLLRKYSLPLVVCGDGMFIEKIVKENDYLLAPHLFVHFNYFQKGRWIK